MEARSVESRSRCALLQEFFDKVEAGLGDGEFYTTSVTGLREKRADALIETYGVPKERPSRAALALLIEVGMLGIVKKRSPAGDRDVEVYTRLRRTMDDGRWTMRIYHLKSCNTVLAIMDMVTVFDCGDGVLAIYVCGGLPQFPQFDLFPHP